MVVRTLPKSGLAMRAPGVPKNGDELEITRKRVVSRGGMILLVVEKEKEFEPKRRGRERARSNNQSEINLAKKGEREKKSSQGES